MVVEDNATIGGILVGLLRESGYRAVRAWDCREAARMARDRRPDLVVFDLGLPYREGFGGVTELRASPELAQTPVLITSTNPLILPTEDQAQLVAAVTKPIDFDRLLNYVRRALGEPEVEVVKPVYTPSDDYLHSW